jgi:hypothetical protein
MTFSMPSDFLVTPIKENENVAYDFAIISKSCKLEVRYRIWPLSEAAEEYEIYKNKKQQDESLNIITDPNKLYPNMIQAMHGNISSQTDWEPFWFDSTAVSREFGADVGMLSLATVNSEFGKGYKYCMIHALHLTNIADAYIFFLYDEHPEIWKTQCLQNVYHSWRFMPHQSQEINMK